MIRATSRLDSPVRWIRWRPSTARKIGLRSADGDDRALAGELDIAEVE
jgi:hypothetical protein